MEPKLLLCTCGDSQALDAGVLEAGAPLRELCGANRDQLEAEMEAGPVMIACTQMEALFAEIAEDLGQAAPACVDLRDRAGWSDEAAQAGPKMAALVAEARLGGAEAPMMDLVSEGRCLVYGPLEEGLDMARALAPHLAVTLVASDGEAPAAPEAQFDIAAGRMRKAAGAFTRFDLEFERFALLGASGRGAPAYGPARDGAKARVDILVDLSGNAPIFPAHEKRDGYFRVKRGDKQGAAEVITEASALRGTFEKPLHIRFEESLCAHSRAGQAACSKCLDLCPTGAILPAGDHVQIDPLICAGCGACAAACPSGAATYAAPAPDLIFRRLHALATTYHAKGGRRARLLVHEPGRAREMIALAARYGLGLPAEVIPFETDAQQGFGHAEMAVAHALGFEEILLLRPGKDPMPEGLAAEITLAEAILGEGRIHALEPATPDALETALRRPRQPGNGAAPSPILALGGRREALRLAARALHPDASAPLPLPKGAPYGRVELDQSACTLCLSCASLCPPGALTDDPDSPRLLFRQDACLQCGLCTGVCPENAITLVPELDLAPSALTERELKAEEPAECIECGAKFGVKSTIERIIAKLEGQHPMFTNSDNARLIRMCDTCRVNAQYHSDAQPFSAAPRPRVRTTDDYKTDS